MRLLGWTRRFMLAGMVASLLASACFAQPPGGGRGGGGGMMMMRGRGGALELLRMDEVRKELKIDATQEKEFEAIAKELQSKSEELRPSGGFGGNPMDMSEEERAEMMKKFEEMAKKLGEFSKGLESKAFEVLDPDQQSRLIGLMIQRGLNSLTNDNVAAAVGITDDQKKKLLEIDAEAAKNMGMGMGMGRNRNGGGGGGGGAPADFEAIQARMEEARKKIEESRLAVLNDEQKAKIETLKGDKFEFPAPQRGGRNGGGRPGGGRPGGAGN